MQKTRWILMAGLPLALAIAAGSTLAQGKGPGGGKPDQAKGQPATGSAEGAPEGRGRDIDKASESRPSRSVRGRKAGQSNRSAPGSAVDGRALGKEIRGGVRGIERRSPVAAAVANGPRPATAPAASRPLSAREFARFKHEGDYGKVSPEVRRFLGSSRPAETMVGGALANSLARGLPLAALLTTSDNGSMNVRNRSGNTLFVLDDASARSLGAWRVAPLSDDVSEGSPRFCRTGSGHPVWGRQWCLDKGFGLGAENQFRWGRTRDPGDLRFLSEPASASLNRDALLALLGPVAFNRLALHAVTLGLADPLAGNWRTDNSGQRFLVVSSARRPVAEIVDFNNDRRADLMLVALRPWR